MLIVTVLILLRTLLFFGQSDMVSVCGKGYTADFIGVLYNSYIIGTQLVVGVNVELTQIGYRTMTMQCYLTPFI